MVNFIEFFDKEKYNYTEVVKFLGISDTEMNEEELRFTLRFAMKKLKLSEKGILSN